MKAIAAIVLVAGAALWSSACDEGAEQTPPAVVSTITLASGRVAGVAVDPATSRIYVARRGPTSEQSLAVVDSATEKQIGDIPLPEGEFFSQIEANPNTGRAYAVDALSNTLFIVDGGSTTVVQAIHATRGHGPGLAINELTNLVYWVDQDITVLDGASNAIVDTISMGLEAGVRSIAVNPTTNRLYASSDARGEIYAVDLDNNSIVGTARVDGAMWVEVNPMTNRLYVTSHQSNDITVIDGATLAVIGTTKSTGMAPSEYQGPYIALDTATNSVYVSNRSSGTVDVLDGDTHKIVATVAVGGEPTVISVNPKTGRVYVANTAWGENPWMQGLTYVSVIARAGQR
jgi:YVTN family beta-propeller protein